jgi:hypothetical protein
VAEVASRQKLVNNNKDNNLTYQRRTPHRASASRYASYGAWRIRRLLSFEVDCSAFADCLFAKPVCKLRDVGCGGGRCPLFVSCCWWWSWSWQWWWWFMPSCMYTDRSRQPDSSGAIFSCKTYRRSDLKYRVAALRFNMSMNDVSMANGPG